MIDVGELVKRARAALQTGNLLVARGYWRRATRVAPDRLDIWLDLYRLSELPAERKRCLERIVELDPDNVEAQTELARLQEELAAIREALETKQAEAQEAPPVEMPAGEGISPPEVKSMDIRPDITDEMRRQWEETVAAGKPLVCINHAERETSLRCNRCGVPICAKCSVRTPVGFRCVECVRGQHTSLFTAQWYDYPLAAFLSLLLSVPAAVLAGRAGWWFALIISPLAGGIIGRIVHRAVGRRRGRWIWLTVGVCIVAGALVALVTSQSSLVPIGVYAFTATGAAVAILRLGKPL